MRILCVAEGLSCIVRNTRTLCDSRLLCACLRRGWGVMGIASGLAGRLRNLRLWSLGGAALAVYGGLRSALLGTHLRLCRRVCRCTRTGCARTFTRDLARLGTPGRRILSVGRLRLSLLLRGLLMGSFLLGKLFGNGRRGTLLRGGSLRRLTALLRA